MKWTPRRYQKRAIQLMLELPAAGLLLDPGLGKTSIALAAFKILRSKSIVRRVLVIAPLNAATLTWPTEASQWDEFKPLRVVVLHGSKKEKLLHEDADVYVINPDGLEWLARQKWAMPDMLVVDESTKFKHTRTQRFKLLKSMLGKFKRRYILTGTPAPNGLMDLFGQIYLLDYGDALGSYITHFRQRYFHPTGFGGYTWKLNDGADEDIFKAIRPMTLRMAAEDYLDLPQLHETNIWVDLPKKARAIYKKLEDELIVQLESGEVTAFNAGTLTTKLRQVANGMVYVERVGDRGHEIIHDAKLDALKDLIDELSGQPLIVVYAFEHERDRIAEELDAPILTGSTKKRTELIDRWNAGEVPVMIMYPQHGLNLQHGGAHLAWYGLTWDLEAYDQTIRRLWRSGQRRTVHIHRITTISSIDSIILSALAGKQRTQNALFEALKQGVKRSEVRSKGPG